MFSCSDDITAPSPRHQPTLAGASFADAVSGISPQVDAGGYHTCGLLNDGSVRCWGYNEYGQTTVPATLGPVAQLTAGAFHNCVLTTDGAVSCWGYNGFGQATPPASLGAVTQISAGNYHTCALRTDGTVVCWGTEGGLQTALPAGLGSVTQISAGIYHSCALKSDRTVTCWGYNDFAQGNLPSDIDDVIQVSVGYALTCVLREGGTVYCRGDNDEGQATVPADLSSVTQISAGEFHVCALKSDGTVVCWGSNWAGQSTVPTGLSSVTKISAGTYHTCAQRSDGSVVCWGLNNFSQTVTDGIDLTTDQPQSIAFTSTPPDPTLVGSTYTVTATGGGSGNDVVFSIPLTTSVCTISGNVVSLIAVGSCVVAADQAAGNDYLAATQATQTFNVSDGQQLQFTSSPPDPAVVGTVYSLAAQGGPSGSPIVFTSLSEAVCTVDGNAASLIGAGTCTVAADQAGGNGYLAATQQTQSFDVVAPQQQVISFTSAPPSPALVGGSYDITAVGGGSGMPVTFASLTSSVCLVLGNSVTFVKIGTCRISADQDGNTYFLPAVQQQQIFDINDVQSIAFTSAPPSPAVVGGAYPVAASGGLSGNPVTFTSLSGGVCSVAGNNVSLIGAGNCVIAADQAAGGGYLAAPRQIQSFAVIEPIAQTITFTSTPPNPPVVGGAYTVAATGGGSGNPVEFTSLTPARCGVTGAMVSFTAAGTCTIAANQAGNAVYLDAGQATQNFEIDTRPVANAGSAQSGSEGAAVAFNASGSSDADGDAIVSYNWNFGDGTSQSVTTPTVQHTFNDNGSYVVTLSVTDSRGATSSPATTSAVIANVAPTATLASASPVPEGPITVSLTSSRDAAGDLSTLQYAFDCGNGSGFGAFSSSPTVSCYGWDNGTLTIRAQVMDKDGATSPIYTAAVSLVNVAPTVTIISAPATGTPGVDYTIQYKFTDPGTKDSPWYHQPNWGDGKKLTLYTTSTQGQTITQTHRYSSAGTYTVTVKAVDKDGATGSTSFQVTIR